RERGELVVLVGGGIEFGERAEERGGAGEVGEFVEVAVAAAEEAEEADDADAHGEAAGGAGAGESLASVVGGRDGELALLDHGDAAFHEVALLDGQLFELLLDFSEGGLFGALFFLVERDGDLVGADVADLVSGDLAQGLELVEARFELRHGAAEG